jgi:hypothetical protein
MSIQYSRLCATLAVAAIAVAPTLRAQYAPAPKVYTVTQISAMFGPPEMMKIYRNGSKAVIDITPPAARGAAATPVRSLYDLRAHTDVSWDPTASAPACGSGTFSGDWGDPFAGSADMAAELAKQNAKKVAAQSIDGFSTDVYEFLEPTTQKTYRVWIDTKYGLIVKLQAGDLTLQEIKQLSTAAPSASLFALPAACRNLPPVLSDADKIAADTGGNATNYVYAHLAPSEPSTAPCSVAFKVVRAGTLAPVAIRYAVGLDLDQNTNGNYTVGVGLAGTAKFSGGGIRDVSPQIRNGALRIANAPPHFYLDVEFGDAGSAAALIYRQCFAPETTLLLVVKNPDKLSDGADWLWSKSGK